jgi:hypothetical protein
LETNDGSYPAGIRVAKGDHKEELKTRRKKKHGERKIKQKDWQKERERTRNLFRFVNI